MREFVRDLTEHLTESAATAPVRQGYGGHSMVAPLKRVLVQTPAPLLSPTDGERFEYLHPVDDARTMAEHTAFTAILSDAGIEVIQRPAAPAGELDSIFVYDSSYITDQGAILTRPGKAVRRPEVALARQAYEELGIPIIGEIEAPGTVEGGDCCWISHDLLAVGEGYRTNAAGIDQLQIILQSIDVEVFRVSLPHWHGEGECLHLLSLLSPVDDRVAVVHLPLMATTFVQLLKSLGWTLIEIPEEEFDTQGTNCLTLEPGKVLMLKDNPITKQRLEAHGIEVLTYTGDEISHNRTGGPTCLTRPILRDTAAERGD